MLALAFLSVAAVAVQAYDNVCYGDLGCFTNAPPWGNTQQRPFDILPDNPSAVNARFYLDTRSQFGAEIYYDDMTSVQSTSFDSTKTTRFIIHGFVDNGNVQWMEDMSDAFLSIEDSNIIRVGWFGGSAQVNYMSAAVDTQIVGRTAGLLIENIKNAFGMGSDQFHCVGHSLGAHTCGYVGDTSQIARISGLDPAGPYFTSTGSVVQLDSSDATFVDVIHSDAETFLSNGIVSGLGINEQSGNVDFWPNDGRQQPGCDQNALSTIIGVDGVVDGTRDFVACNHQRAVKFFTESITSPCYFTSFPCLNYDEFTSGKCLNCEGTGCPKMGFNAINYENQIGSDKVKTFLSTNALSPFCEYMTYVGITLGTNSKSIDGSLYLTIYGQWDVTEQEQIGGEGAEFQLQPGGYYSALVYYDYNSGPINYVKVLWDKKELNIGKDYITVESVSLFVGATQKTLNFCGDTSVEMDELKRYTINYC